MGNLGLNTFKNLPNGTSVKFVDGNAMFCTPAPFQSRYDPISSSLPQCQVRECHFRGFVYFKDSKFAYKQCPGGAYWDKTEKNGTGCSEVGPTQYIYQRFTKRYELMTCCTPKCNPIACPAGFERCPVGSTDPNACAPCKAGSYGGAGTPCLLCPEGKYQTLSGMTSCHKCPSSNMQVFKAISQLVSPLRCCYKLICSCLQAAKGSKSRSECVCKAGFYPPPLNTVLLAGSRRGMSDGFGSEAAFNFPLIAAVSHDQRFAFVSGMFPNCSNNWLCYAHPRQQTLLVITAK
jgi:hypothetical protein